MVNKSYTISAQLLVMVAVAALWPQQDRFATGLFRGLPTVAEISGEAKARTLPAILSGRDVRLYKELFAAQEAGKWKQADEIAADVKSDILVGHALADRYLSSRYQPKAAELAEWLAKYSDHPQAYDIYNLALIKSPTSKNNLENIQKPKQLALNFGTDQGSALRFESSGRAAYWQGGIDAWRKGNKASAAKSFMVLAESKNLTNWQASAANYWAWRALDAMGKTNEAKPYLIRAAEDGRSFYSILARRQLGEAVVNSDKIQLSDNDVLEMIQDASVRRVIALSQVGKNELAERELRVAFPQANIDGKMRLLALAHDLNLASVQINMARYLDKDGIAVDFALYPIPHWQPQDGFKIDPALIYAVTRQESGFKTTVTSTAGAQGLMQLMPNTARMMKKDLNIVSDANANEPAVNMMLGQNYLRHLLNHKMVDGNMIYMLTAYNAGAGRLQEWKQTLPTNDPLLFVESIPLGETRAYVMQVMTNYWIYSEMNGNTNATITNLARGDWPSYDTTVPVAQIRTADING